METHSGYKDSIMYNSISSSNDNRIDLGVRRFHQDLTKYVTNNRNRLEQIEKLVKNANDLHIPGGSSSSVNASSNVYRYEEEDARVKKFEMLQRNIDDIYNQLTKMKSSLDRPVKCSLKDLVQNVGVSSLLASYEALASQAELCSINPDEFGKSKLKYENVDEEKDDQREEIKENFDVRTPKMQIGKSLSEIATKTKFESVAKERTGLISLKKKDELQSIKKSIATTIKPITENDLDSLPGYLRRQVTLHQLIATLESFSTSQVATTNANESLDQSCTLLALTKLGRLKNKGGGKYELIA